MKLQQSKELEQQKIDIENEFNNTVKSPMKKQHDQDLKKLNQTYKTELSNLKIGINYTYLSIC